MDKKLKIKRIRSENWDSNDKKLLRELIRPNISIIENKSVDTCTSKAKREAWKRVTLAFNRRSEIARHTPQLQSKWRSIRCNAKRSVSASHKNKRVTYTYTKPQPELPDPLIESFPLKLEIDYNEIECDLSGSLSPQQKDEEIKEHSFSEEIMKHHLLGDEIKEHLIGEDIKEDLLDEKMEEHLLNEEIKKHLLSDENEEDQPGGEIKKNLHMIEKRNEYRSEQIYLKLEHEEKIKTLIMERTEKLKTFKMEREERKKTMQLERTLMIVRHRMQIKNLQQGVEL